MEPPHDRLTSTFDLVAELTSRGASTSIAGNANGGRQLRRSPAARTYRPGTSATSPLAYGESPYGYLMPRRIEPAMALLRRGDLSGTEVCFAVGCASLGTFSTRFTEVVGMPPSTYRRHAARATGGDAVVRGETGDRTDEESRTAGHGAQLA